MTLRLFFFGSPRIECDGRVIDTDTRKAVALLAYLAVTGEFHSRDTLATLLWPEMDAERSRAALRRTLSSLKSAIGQEFLYITRDGIGLLSEGMVWCDVNTFESAITKTTHHHRAGDSQCDDCVEELEAAVVLYRDHFLSGFSLRDSAVFDDWQLAQTEHLRRLLALALNALVRTYSRQHRFDVAIDHARRWLAIDPLREDAHRWLMQIYAWNGTRELALRQYREVVRILADELGVEPLPETTELYEAIQENRLSLPENITVIGNDPAGESDTIPPADSGKQSLSKPLIGRESSWEVMQQAYAEVDPSGRVVAVAGETGIGKTRLAEAFAEFAQTQEATTIVAPCYQGEAGLAYGPIATALNTLVHREDATERLQKVPAHWRGEAARLVPELIDNDPTYVELDGPGAQIRFYSGISEVLCALLAGPSPGVLLIDDAQWADAATFDLLAYLVRRLTDLPVLVLITWDESVGHEHRLYRLLAEAQRAGTGHLVHLTRWRPSDVLRLVTANESLRSQAAEIAGRLYQETEGLPYFVVEYLAVGQNPEEWSMPQSVRDLLAGRLASVGQAERQLLQTAAVIGHSFDYGILLETSGRSEEEVIGGLERLLGSGLIRELSTESPAVELHYDFSHQQLRSLVYDETNLARRRLLHRRVAAALQTLRRGSHLEASAGLIADHYRLGGQDDLAADFYHRAGDHARTLYAHREALAHYQTALALEHPAQAALYEAAGDLHTLQGEYRAALHAYESAAAQAGKDRLGRLEHKLGQVYERRGDWELADCHYCAALERYGPDQPVEKALLTVDRSRVAYRSGKIASAEALAEEALALAKAAGDMGAEAQAHNALGILARKAGNSPTARAHMQQSLSLAESEGLTTVRIAALNNLAHVHGEANQVEKALELLEQAILLCARQGDRHREAALYNHRADLLHQAGQEDLAMASLKQAVAIIAEIGLEAGDWQPEVWKLTEW
jgi:DNA-binding SARP family transcriptional activator/predicted ATPase